MVEIGTSSQFTVFLEGTDHKGFKTSQRRKPFPAGGEWPGSAACLQETDGV